MTLKYHKRALDLLGIDAVVSGSALLTLERNERLSGLRFPPSVREWYSLQEAVDILERCSNDPPVRLDDLGRPVYDLAGEVSHDLLQRGLLCIRRENQGVCMWAARLDGSDDPPVDVTDDPRLATWRAASSSFSEHVFSWIWDFAVALGRTHVVQAVVAEAPTAADLRHLRIQFEEGPRTFGWPRDVLHRFQRGDQAVFICASPDEADWYLSADSSESLKELIRTVWHCGGALGESLYATNEIGKDVLRALRHKNGVE